MTKEEIKAQIKTILMGDTTIFNQLMLDDIEKKAEDLTNLFYEQIRTK